MELIDWNDMKFWLLLVWWIILVWILTMNIVSKKIDSSGRDKDRWVTYSILFTPVVTALLLFVLEKIGTNNKKSNKRIRNNSYKNIAVVTFIYSITALISSMFAYISNGIDLSTEGLIFGGISLGVATYIFIRVRNMINLIYEKTIVNVVVTMCILMEIVIYVAKVYVYSNGIDVMSNNLALYFGIILSMIYGVIGIIYGRGIKRVTADSDFKMYGNFLIISSVFMVTGLGYFIAGILNAVAYFYLSIIFKNSDRALQIKNGEIKDSWEVMVEAERYFDKLDFAEYEKIKEKAVEYLPKELSEEDKKRAIIKYIANNYI